MKTSVKSICCSIVLFSMIILSAGCATKSSLESTTNNKDKYSQIFQQQHKPVLVPTAESAIGTPYKYGGVNKNGFDCSGFVKWVYSHAGVNVPRTAREQSKIGKVIKDQDKMQVGDIVAFYSKKRGYHTGIYVGDGKFVHSPRRRTKVRISELSTSFFSKSFLGARRVLDDIKDSEKDAAQKMLEQYALKYHADAKKNKKKSS